MEKNREITMLRGLALCSVVAIHVLSIGLTNVTTGMSSWGYKIFHALLEYSVPCFLFISSILLSYKLKGKKLDIKNFYLKKLMRVLIPYILWTLFYLLFSLVTRQISIRDLFQWKKWVFWFGLGKSYTHLYYMSIVMQLYLFAPILIAFVQGIQKLFKKFDFIALIIIITISEVAVYFTNRYYVYSHFPYHSSLMIWYIYIILLGIWIGFNYKQFQQGLNKYIPIVGILYIISTLFYIRYKVCIVQGIRISTACYQWVWVSYVVLATLVLYWICLHMSKRKVENRWTHIIEIIGDYSFGIYLMHPVLTFVLRRLVHVTQPLLLIIILTISYIMIMIVCIGIIKILRMNKWLNIIVGEYTLWKIEKQNRQKAIYREVN